MITGFKTVNKDIVSIYSYTDTGNADLLGMATRYTPGSSPDKAGLRNPALTAFVDAPTADFLRGVVHRRTETRCGSAFYAVRQEGTDLIARVDVFNAASRKNPRLVVPILSGNVRNGRAVFRDAANQLCVPIPFSLKPAKGLSPYQVTDGPAHSGYRVGSPIVQIYNTADRLQQELDRLAYPVRVGGDGRLEKAPDRVFPLAESDLAETTEEAVITQVRRAPQGSGPKTR